MGFLDKFKKKREDAEKSKEETKVKIEKKVEKITKKTTKKSDKAPVTKKKKDLKGSAYRVLISPIISEKAAVYETAGVYTFAVAKKATKVEIKNSVKQVYGVEPKKVRIINMEGKKQRFGRKFGRRSDWKKAMVSLPKGQSISIHEGV